MRPKKLDVSYSSENEQISPIGSRYTTKIAKIFGEESYIQAILDVEAENAKVISEMYPSKIPRKDAQKLKSVADTGHVRPEEVRKVEANKTHHEMGAIISVMSKEAGDSAKYVHFAMTSADAVETAKAMQIGSALGLLIKSVSQTRDECLKRALEWKDTPAITRTHGQHAIPASFGLSFAFFGYCLQKNIEKLKSDRDMYVTGKLSGVIGTYDVHTNEGIDGRKIESTVLGNLKVKPSEMSMQTPPREDIAYIISDIAILCGRLETIASYIKMLKRTEILELKEVPDEESIGSSAMPHKNMYGNPFIEERCISIARIVRGYALSSMESLLSEDFRDLTASMSDRIVIPESFILADYSSALIKNVLERIEVIPGNVERNLEYTKGTVASQLVMSRLIEKGLQRQKARELSLADASSAVKKNMSYLDALMKDREITRLLTKDEIKELCDPRSNMGKSREIIERIAKNYLNKK